MAFFLAVLGLIVSLMLFALCLHVLKNQEG